MIESKEYIKNGAIFVLILTSIFGFIPMGESTHVCFENGIVTKEGTFDRLSGTGITGYPNVDNNKGYKRCSTGWITIDKTSESSEEPISQNELIKVKTNGGDTIDCEVINNIVTQSCYYNGKNAFLSEFT